MKNRLSLLLIALFLTISTAVIAQTTSLSTMQSISAYTTLASGGEFGISLSEPTIKDVIMPGEESDFTVTVTNSGSVSTYLIATIDIPEDFSIDDGAGISSDWTKLATDKDGNGLDNVYYFGSGDDLAIFKTETTILNKLTLRSDLELPAEQEQQINYDINITVWAYQKNAETAAMSPADLWEEAKTWQPGD